MATARSHRPAGTGWFTFAGVMFGLTGVSNLLWGIGALDSKEYLPENGLLASNLNVLGWLSLAWAAMALIGAWLLFTRSASSAGIGICLAGINAIFWLFALPVLPIWSLIVMSIDVLIIYGLAVHSDVVDR
jgi:hypothetical protein